MLQRSNQNLNLLEPIPPGVAEVTGIIQTVDVVQRELMLLVRGHQIVVDVPPECPVVLRGERIKLRIIQPGDIVRIKVDRASHCVAQQIEVVPINFLPAADTL